MASRLEGPRYGFTDAIGRQEQPLVVLRPGMEKLNVLGIELASEGSRIGKHRQEGGPAALAFSVEGLPLE
jgi:hypothetical protein